MLDFNNAIFSDFQSDSATNIENQVFKESLNE